MYRGNEASKVGEVMERKAAGDLAGVLTAALEFWLAPPEHPGEFDGASREVWRAIAELDAVPAAVHTALPALRGKRVVRPLAFIDIVENLDDNTVLLELASIALDANWPAHPYLASICFTLVDRQAEDELWDWILQHRARLTTQTPAWALVSIILSTTRVGSNNDLTNWFASSFEHRSDMPMFVAAAYLVAVAQTASQKHVAYVATYATARGLPDRTGAYLLAHAMCEQLRDGKLDEFAAAFTERGGLITPDLSDLRHPLVAYINGAKRRHAVTDEDLTFTLESYDAVVVGGLARVAVQNRGPRPTNWRLAVHLRDYDPFIATAARILSVFAQMIALPKGHGDAVILYREMSKARPKSIPSLMPVWQRLVKARIPFFRRLRLEYF